MYVRPNVVSLVSVELKTFVSDVVAECDRF